MTATAKLTELELVSLPGFAERLGIPPRYRKARLTDVDEHTAARAIKALGDEGLLLLGGVGSGKTHLAAALLLEAAVAERMRERDAFLASHPDPDRDPEWASRQLLDSQLARKAAKAYRFVSVPELAQETRDAASDGRLNAVLDGCSEPGLVVFDDLGASRDTQFLEDALYLVVCRRYNAMLPSVFTSNLSLEQLGHGLGYRTVSRINGTCQILDLGTQDRRA